MNPPPIHSLALALALALALPFSSPAAHPPPASDPDTKWGKDIAALEAAARNSPPHPFLFIGSSSIRRWTLPDSWPSRPLLNQGFGGSILPDSIHFFDRLVTPHQPRAIILYAGDNDIARGHDAARVFADYLAFVDLAAQRLPGTPVIFIAIKPSPARWNLWPVARAANQLIKHHTREHDHLFFAAIDSPMLAHRLDQPPASDWFVSDNLHLSPSGYARWTQVIDPLLTLAHARYLARPQP